MVMKGETIMTGANGGHFGTNGYSQLMVRHSPAGYYLGTTLTDSDGWTEPGSRESGYFTTEEEAEHALTEWNKGNYINIRR